MFWGNRTEGMLNLSALTTRPFSVTGLSFPLEKCPLVFWGNRMEGMLNLSTLTTRPFSVNGLSFPLEKCPLVTPGGIEPGHSEF